MSYRPMIGGRLREGTSGVDSYRLDAIAGARTPKRKWVRPDCYLASQFGAWRHGGE